MLIDEFLPTYNFTEHHHLEIAAPAEEVYGIVRKLDLSGSVLVRILFELRSVPALFQARSRRRQALGLTLDDLLKTGFILLGETPPQELVLGLIGKFWTASGCLQKLEAKNFREFAIPGFAKAAWNFTLARSEGGRTRLATETRVQCLDEASHRKFQRYWFFVRPFSGLIRREALLACKRRVESPANVA